MDVERIEVLRGPQGTLYGAGTLAGAVRVLPIAPKLGEYSGMASAGGAVVAHSTKLDYDFTGAVNLPLGDVAALRLVAKHEYAAGFIDQTDILKRQGNDYINGTPLLANPADVVGSSPIYFDQKDSNWARTTAIRAAFTVKPSGPFTLDVSYNYARITGVGGPKDNHTYGGGQLTTAYFDYYATNPFVPQSIDPSKNHRATGRYEISSGTLEPFERSSQLLSVDPSVDLGFATLAGTFSVGKTDAKAALNGTSNILGLPFFTKYSTDIPAYPRFLDVYVQHDKETTTTQELRLVSNGKNTFDYVAGVYLQQQKRDMRQEIYIPGVDAYEAALHADPAEYLIHSNNGQVTNNPTTQKYNESAVYGNLTWNATEKWQVTGGARVFRQTFDQKLLLDIPNFFIFENVSNSDKKTSQIFMLNTSYEFTPGIKGYATLSQGYRRGGANAFPRYVPATDFRYVVSENDSMLKYAPDKTNNLEVGVKGKSGEFFFSLAAFYIRWSNPQIDIQTPYLVPGGGQRQGGDFQGPRVRVLGAAGHRWPDLQRRPCLHPGAAVGRLRHRREHRCADRPARPAVGSAGRPRGHRGQDRRPPAGLPRLQRLGQPELRVAARQRRQAQVHARCRLPRLHGDDPALDQPGSHAQLDDWRLLYAPWEHRAHQGRLALRPVWHQPRRPLRGRVAQCAAAVEHRHAGRLR